MAQYQIVDNITGRKITLEADSPPTDEESLELFAQYGGGEKPPPIQAVPIDSKEPGIFDKKWPFPGDNPQPRQQDSGIIQQTFDQYSKPLPDNKMLSKKYLEENVAPSAARIVPQAITGTISMPYNAAKKFTDPIYNALTGQQKLGSAASDLWNAPKNAAGEFMNGLGQTMAAPWGLGAEKGDANRAWNDPAAALMAAAPVAGVGMKGVAAGMPKDVALGLTKKSLKFSPGIEPELQNRVAKTVLENDASTTGTSYGEFKQTIKDLNESVKGMIEPVAGEKITVTPDSWVQDLLNKAQTSGEKTKDIAEITQFLEEFKADHPELTVGEAQKVKISLNKKLEAFEKARQAGKSTENAAREDAMRAVANGLRGEIEKFAPETKKTNQQIHEMLIAKPFLKTAANKAENQATFSGRDMVAGGVAGLMTSNPGVGSAVMIGSRLLRDPRVQSKAAIMLDSISDFKAKIGKILQPERAAAIVEEFGTAPDTPNQLALPAPTGETSAYQHIVDIAQTPGGMEFLTEKLGRTKGDAEMLKIIKEAAGAIPTQNYPLQTVPNTSVYHIPKTNALGQ